MKIGITCGLAATAKGTAALSSAKTEQAGRQALTLIAEAQPIFCKVSANRRQSKVNDEVFYNLLGGGGDYLGSSKPFLYKSGTTL